MLSSSSLLDEASISARVSGDWLRKRAGGPADRRPAAAAGGGEPFLMLPAKDMMVVEVAVVGLGVEVVGDGREGVCVLSGVLVLAPPWPELAAEFH
jgi:hypothetical protein